MVPLSWKRVVIYQLPENSIQNVKEQCALDPCSYGKVSAGLYRGTLIIAFGRSFQEHDFILSVAQDALDLGGDPSACTWTGGARWSLESGLPIIYDTSATLGGALRPEVKAAALQLLKDHL